ncbi:unnamed protein product, partial [Rotaria sp. Silwood1]
PTSSYDIVKTERKSGFTIPKKMKKTSNLNSDSTAVVSSIKTVKTTDKHARLQDSLPQLPPPPLPLSSTVSTSISNVLSSKQLEPVQVHSVVSSVGQQAKQQQSVIQSVSVKPLLNNSPSSSSSSSNTKPSQLSNEINRTMIIQSPRKKRDFYGKSSGPSTTSTSPSSSTSSPNNKSHRHMNTIDSSSSNKNRPSSTPACTTTIRTPNLPDRPVSIPPLKTSS